ncbi:hypothetical protein BLAT2472_10401 [Burkholderia latens]
MRRGTAATLTRRKPDVAYAHLVEIAAERGLTLLTTEWGGSKFDYEFRCARGHEWPTPGHSVFGGAWFRHSVNLAKRRTIWHRLRAARARPAMRVTAAKAIPCDT